MSLEVKINPEPSSNYPENILNICRPGEWVWRVSAHCDELTLQKIETAAYQKTTQYPLVGNDIRKDGVCPTKTARLFHALEHLMALEFLKNGVIPESELNNGNIACTVPATTPDGKEITAFWFRDGLIDEKLIEEALINIIDMFGN